MRAVPIALFLGVLVTSVRSAAADRAEYDAPRIGSPADLLPRLPAPFLLPDLSHPFLDVRADGVVAKAVPIDDRAAAPFAAARAEIEGTWFLPRQLYFGALLPYAGAPVLDPEPARGRRDFLGNVEAHARIVFPMPTSLDFGFVLGLVLPTAMFDRNALENRSATALAASIAPSDSVHFLPGRAALRPAADVRILRGPVVLQGRQGIDIVIDTAGIDRVRTAGRLVAHAGILVRRDLEVSVEGSQVYFFTSDDSPEVADPFGERYRVSDDRRYAFTVSPGIRMAFTDIDVGASISTNVGRAFSPAADAIVAGRISLVAHLR